MKPLAGLRILEFDGLGPVTFAGMVLADLGAEVLRLVRSPKAGAPVFADVGGEVLHRGRPAVEVNLKDSNDLSRVLALVGGADALIEGFRPGVMERLGLGPDVCAARNAGLVYGRVTGWGQTGPMADQVGPDRAPRAPLNLVGDYGGGAMLLVVGVLAGLLEARTTGRGRVVDAAMTDGSALLTGLFHALSARGLWSEARGENLLDGGAPFYRSYACRDGRYVAVGALEPRFYAALLAGLEIAPDSAPQYDVPRWPGLHARLEAVFQTRDRDDWAARFAGSEACVTPVLTLAEAAGHPHNRARGTFGDPVPQPAPAPRFDGAPPEITGPFPPLSLDDAVTRWA